MRGVLEASFVLKPPSLEARARDLVSKQTPSRDGKHLVSFASFAGVLRRRALGALGLVNVPEPHRFGRGVTCTCLADPKANTRWGEIDWIRFQRRF